MVPLSTLIPLAIVALVVIAEAMDDFKASRELIASYPKLYRRIRRRMHL